MIGATTFVLLTLLPVAPFAQERPDFSGRWTLVPERSIFQTTEGTATFLALGPDFTAKMEDTDTLILTLATEWHRPWRINLNGEPTLHADSGPNEKIVRTTITTEWEGQRLIIRMEGTEIGESKATTFTKRYRLALNLNHTLTVESPLGAGGAWLVSTYRWLEAM